MKAPLSNCNVCRKFRLSRNALTNVPFLMRDRTQVPYSFLTAHPSKKRLTRPKYGQVTGAQLLVCSRQAHSTNMIRGPNHGGSYGLRFNWLPSHRRCGLRGQALSMSRGPSLCLCFAQCANFKLWN